MLCQQLAALLLPSFPSYLPYLPLAQAFARRFQAPAPPSQAPPEMLLARLLLLLAPDQMPVRSRALRLFCWLKRPDAPSPRPDAKPKTVPVDWHHPQWPANQSQLARRRAATAQPAWQIRSGAGRYS